jgi:AcrR family transcriptional regulator
MPTSKKPVSATKSAADRKPAAKATSAAKAQEEPARRRYPPEVRRQKIFEVAKEILQRDPEASIDDIAEAAGVTRQLISLYFPGGGTGPFYAAMFDEYLLALPGILGEGFLSESTKPSGVRKTTERGVAAFIDWVEAVGQSWVFTGKHQPHGAGIAERLESTAEFTIEMMVHARSDIEDSGLSRAAIYAQLDGMLALVGRMLEGRVERADAEAVIVENFVALFTTVLPALRSD